MRIYQVGGAVRDRLLGLPVKDHDWVVVGATPDAMLAQGFKPVGKDFPVFLHPETHEEYALARTERKSGRGYKGFVVHADPDVTLEEDLARRDLTINAMAQDEDGALIDPYHGADDIQARVLRHVSPAFVEDPVRILRIARFAARFDFEVAPETQALMQQMVADGEVDHLVSERVWQEFAKGLMEAQPSRMLMVLRECGALARLMPELDSLFGVPQPPQHHPEVDTGIHTLMALDMAARMALPLAARWAVLLHDLGKGSTPAELLPHHHGHEDRGVELAEAVSQRLRVPVDCREMAVLASRWHTHIHRAMELRPQTLLKVLEGVDAFRKPERLECLIRVAEADARGRTGFEQRDYPQGDRVRQALDAARTVNAGEVAKQVADPSRIRQAVHDARLHAIRDSMGGAATE